MDRAPLYEWYGKEYVFEEKGADWYWALGIIALAAMIACILFNNILLALVVLAAACSLALLAAKHPRTHHFMIFDIGVGIDTSLYLYQDMVDFSVLEYLDETLPPALSIKTSRILAPHILIPIVDHDPIEIYGYISQHLPEGMHENSLLDHLISLLKL
ncbi:MAG TPA: hypothetical protein VGN56_02055 [Candidatus Paceibacterota bacterium]|jgi:hypothetical protein|nr:hypothetical protein [Candidatus Paceibacterota bacterium]